MLCLVKATPCEPAPDSARRFIRDNEKQAFDMRVREQHAVKRVLVDWRKLSVAMGCSLKIASSRQLWSRSPRRSRRGDAEILRRRLARIDRLERPPSPAFSAVVCVLKNGGEFF
jgi:hypothetical protein